jgi:hypothetical protein
MRTTDPNSPWESPRFCYLDHTPDRPHPAIVRVGVTTTRRPQRVVVVGLLLLLLLLLVVVVLLLLLMLGMEEE